MYRIEKGTGDIIIDGWEQGIASSPHKGIGALKNANISTQTGEALVSFHRDLQSQTIATAQTLTASGSTTFLDSTQSLQVGTWVTIASSSITSLPAGTYYVSSKNVSNQITLSTYYDPTATFSLITHGTSGTATFSTAYDMGNPVAKATERYNDSSGANQQRYYILDANGRVYVYDTANESTTGLLWFLPDINTVFAVSASLATAGIAVINGQLLLFSSGNVYVKATVDLGGRSSSATTFIPVFMNTLLSKSDSPNPHYALVSHQGRCYYTDGNYIGSIFPDSTLTGAVTRSNVQSYCSWTAPYYDTIRISALISGSPPIEQNSNSTFKRVPAFFFVPQGGTLPTAISPYAIYWIQPSNVYTINDYEVYAAETGGVALNVQTGAVGAQYFNTFFPYDLGGSGNTYPTCVITPKRVNLPSFEIAQSLVEIGNTVLIGCKGDTVYPWNQIDSTPSGIISLPEANVTSMVTVNQMAYIFCGNQGNIYISDGSLASLVLNVPDYVSGVPGSPASYIEPTVYFGGTMYLRGRVYFSLFDQTSTKVGNNGGIWSFVPTQNLYIGQDTGLSLRMESKNSYGTYNGTDTLLIPRYTQNSIVPLYWSAWYSSITSPVYGIDYSGIGTDANFPAIIETDIIPTGTMLNKETFTQVEYKLTSPLDTNATVTMAYRINETDAWTALNSFITDSSGLSGYVPVNFEKTQWVQLQITLTPITSSADSNSFVRLREVRIKS